MIKAVTVLFSSTLFVRLCDSAVHWRGSAGESCLYRGDTTDSSQNILRFIFHQSIPRSKYKV